MSECNCNDCLKKCQNCDNYKSFTNTLGKRMYCNCLDYNRVIEPCNQDNKRECYRQHGYFDITPDICAWNRLQTNDNMFMGCDTYFPYRNDINLHGLESQLKFMGQQHGAIRNDGYIKYDILRDTVVHCSMNQRQGTDPIGKCGIMRTVSVDPAYTSQPLKNPMKVNIIDGALKFQYKTMNVQFDFVNCPYGEMHMYDPDFALFDYRIYGLGPVSDGSAAYSLNAIYSGVRCNSAFGNDQTFGIKASHWPIMYIQRFNKQTSQSSCIGIFLDHYRKLEYDYSALEKTGVLRFLSREPEFRFFVFYGDSLADVRREYMAVIGPPSVPVRKLLGCWVGGFGYKSSLQIAQEIKHLRDNQFPIDGFYLDLYWYGQTFPVKTGVDKNKYADNVCNISAKGACAGGMNGVVEITKTDEVGNFEWDTDLFDRNELDMFYDKYGYAMTLIYEPFYNLNSNDLSTLYAKQLVATSGPRKYVQPDAVWNSWLGSVIIPDFTQDESGDYFYKTRMKDRMTHGMCLWWNDLGEPEVYAEDAMYAGMGPVINGQMVSLDVYAQHPSVHNYVQFMWTRGCSEAYEEDQHKRFNVLTRASCPGISRYGAYSWTGDTTSNYSDMRAHFKNMGTLVVSGQDLVVSDAGGFGADGWAQGQIYSHWFANCCATEVSVKPHKWFNSDVLTASPAKWGDVAKNLLNLKFRYEHLPYYYSILYSITNQGHRQGKHFSMPLFLTRSERRLFEDNEAGLMYAIGDDMCVPLFMDNATGGFKGKRQVRLPLGEPYYRAGVWLQDEFEFDNADPLVVPLYRNNSIIYRTQLPSNLVDVRATDARPLEVHIYVKSGNVNEARPTFLYLDDGIGLDKAVKVDITVVKGELVLTYSGHAKAVNIVKTTMNEKPIVMKVNHKIPPHPVLKIGFFIVLLLLIVGALLFLFRK